MPSTYKQSFKQNYTDNVELSIFNCGLQSCERGYTWGPGVRDHYLIHYVVDGKGTYTVNNTVYELRAGDIFLAKPSQLITYSADKEEPWEYYWVGFNGACANKLVLQLPFREGMPTHQCKNAERVKKALFNIFLSRGPEPRNETLMVGYLYLFIAELMQEAMDLEPHASNSSSQYVKVIPTQPYVTSMSSTQSSISSSTIPMTSASTISPRPWASAAAICTGYS